MIEGTSDVSVPTPAAKPHFAGLSPNFVTNGFLEEAYNSTAATRGHYQYTEAQFHGGLGLDDIEAIYVSKKNGLSFLDVFRIRRIFKKFKSLHPDSKIELIFY